jgi:2-polyprenyl-6-methoxyphenol hydroxylase-like FAD-dependent oxidoreductase
MKQKTQVVIVGAGPTGLTLAMLLAKRGIAVQLVEASQNFRRTFRGEGLMPSGLEAIDQLELSDLIEHIPHRPLDGWEFYLENRQIFRVNEPMETVGQPCTLISQPAFLQAVVDRANHYQCFKFIKGTSVRDLMWQGDRVSGVQLSDGSQIAADLVIGADGRNSIVRQKASLSLEQEAQSFNVLWFKLASSESFATENVFYSILKGREGFGVFQGSEGDLQVGWSLHKDNPLKWLLIGWQHIFISKQD